MSLLLNRQLKIGSVVAVSLLGISALVAPTTDAEAQQPLLIQAHGAGAKKPPGIADGLQISTATLPEHTLRDIGLLLAEKAARNSSQGKVDSALVYALMNHRVNVGGYTIELRPNYLATSPSVRVELSGRLDAPLMDLITGYGGENFRFQPHHRQARGWLPLTAVETLADWPQITAIQLALRPINQSINISEGDGAHGADQARVTFASDGRGVKVCVLSDGVDTLAQRQATGDLPNTVDLLSGAQGSGDEGTAMLEIIHDLAPGAELGFATALGGEDAFADNIERLRFEANCDVIVDDIFYFSEGVFQDDVIAQAVNAVADDGALYFSAAGNSGNLNDGTAGVWEGDFVPGAPVGLRSGRRRISGQLHAFAPDRISNPITNDSPYLYMLQWSDPLGASSNDYDLFLINSAGNVVAASTNVQNGDDDPYEWIDSSFFNDNGLSLVIFKPDTAADRFLHLNSHRGQLAFATDGQTSGHSAAQGAISVAAVDHQQAGESGRFDGDEVVEWFSSDGPRRLFYAADGSALTPDNFRSSGGQLRQKPDLTAADGVATATPGFNPFYGTSAAAPHAAAIAALALSLRSDISAKTVRDLLTRTALDIEAPGMDQDSGAGIVDAFALLEAAENADVEPLIEPD